MQTALQGPDENHQDLKNSITPILRRLGGLSANIEAAAVISSDGLSIASVLGYGVDPDRFGAMCASLLALADTTAKEINRGQLKQVMIEGENGFMLAVHVGSDAVLAVAAGANTNLGMVFMEARKACAEISKYL